MPLRDFAERYPALTSRLCQARQNGRVAHAYLLTGDQPEILDDFAAAWLQTCVCESPRDDGDACGQCPSCTQLAGGTYPFLHQVRPRSKARWIRLENIYELEHYLNLTSDSKKRKLALIHDADRMNIQTQNAFLKTLEEPPGKDTIIILVTQNPAMLLPTIRSRCQSIALLGNRIKYEFAEAGQKERFFAALARLQPESGAQAGIFAAEEMLAILEQFQQMAKAEAEEHRKELTRGIKDLEPALKKQIDEEVEAEQKTRYLAYRAQLLSALHTWFAQEYIRASGVKAELLPNPELLEYVGMKVCQHVSEEGEEPPAPHSHTPTPPHSLIDARRSLQLADELLDTLSKYNVDEKLALEDFCQKVAKKRSMRV